LYEGKGGGPGPYEKVRRTLYGEKSGENTPRNASAAPRKGRKRKKNAASPTREKEGRRKVPLIPSKRGGEKRKTSVIMPREEDRENGMLSKARGSEMLP